MRQIIHHHIGVRAQGMILTAGIWTLIGVGAVIAPATDLPGAWHLLLPPWVRVVLWCAPAMLALATAASERWSPYGLAALVVPPTIWLCSLLTAWVLDVWPGPPPGDPVGWYRAGFYGAMIALVVLLSHIPANVREPLSGHPR